MTILTQISNRLHAVYPEGEAKALARWVMEVCFGLTQADILMGKDKDLSADDHRKLENITARLLKREPVQYILGVADFGGRQFTVTPDVLIPRPETVEVVNELTHQLSAHPAAHDNELHVLDIGTGSGCIAITIALDLPHTRLTAWDISPAALQMAAANAQKLGASILFEQKDILHIDKEDRRWDAIISNPPYICQEEASGMDANVLDFEPHLALFVPNEDPLIFYRTIAIFAREHLNKGGLLVFEINRRFGKETSDLLQAMDFHDINIKNDMYDNPRIITARL